MSKRPTKAQRKAQIELARDIANAEMARIINFVATRDDLHRTVLNSASYGEVEAWNLAMCWIQNAENDKNDLVAAVQCSLSDETPEVGAYFRALGIKF